MDSVLRSAQEPIDAVVQCLNTSSLSPPRLMADAAANVVRALRQHRSRKDRVLPCLVVMSAIGVGESHKVAPWLSNLLVDYHSGTVMIYKDHNELDGEIEENCGAEVDWILALLKILPRAQADWVLILLEIMVRWLDSESKRVKAWRLCKGP